MSDMFLAGSDTTSTTLNWVIVYLMNYPEVQKKLYEEIDGVVGSRFPSLSDRSRYSNLISTY
jgi:cytochrome P450